MIVSASGMATGGRVVHHLKVMTDGTQPVGCGIGPALEAHDVVAVLRAERGAPRDLRERALALAARVLEFAPGAAPGSGRLRAAQILESGLAWRKFQAICDAQGGLREPGRAPLTHVVGAARGGECTAIDNRRIAQVAKLAGAPRAATAGVELHVRLGERVDHKAPLYTVHAESRGELECALGFAAQRADIVQLVER